LSWGRKREETWKRTAGNFTKGEKRKRGKNSFFFIRGDFFGLLCFLNYVRLSAGPVINQLSQISFHIGHNKV
jgi:hypothetical protein